jgi:uncharacterized protein DUF2442
MVPRGVRGTPSAGLERTVATCRGSASSTESPSACTGTKVSMRGRTSTRYSGEAASVAFDGEIIAGSLPPRPVLWSRNGRDFIAPDSTRTGSGHAGRNRSRRSSHFLRIEALEELVDITRVEVVGEHRLRLTFADRMSGEVDFGGREWGGVLGPLGDPAFFARVYVDDPEAGTIAWPGGLDLAPEPLYEEARRAVR